jgi:acetate kinase
MGTEVLVVNCGSSSLKFRVLDPVHGTESASGKAERLGALEPGSVTVRAGDRTWSETVAPSDHHTALDTIVGHLREANVLDRVNAVGHRVVHGGETFREPVQIDDRVVHRIAELAPFAPLHNPVNLRGIEGARAVLSDRPHVAVFDTAFHHTLPPAAFLYALPRWLYERAGVRRYGFHGTSHRWVSRRAALLLGRDDVGLVTAHLGNGCSAAAVQDGRSLDTTMGMTPLEGLVMGTRSGDIDPGMLPRLAELTNRSVEGLVDLFNRESGLLGLSELSNDMRTILDARRANDSRAAEAVAVFCHRLSKAVAGLCTSLRRFDGLVFTGGIGENACEIRAEVLQRLHLFGFEVDPVANAQHGAGTAGRITAQASRSAWVIPTDEERSIAEETAQLLGLGKQS